MRFNNLYLIIISIFMVGQSFAQPFYNKIIPSNSFQPPSAVNLLYHDDKLLLCYGYISEDIDGDREKSSIIVLDTFDFEKIREIIYDSIDTGLIGLVSNNDRLYLFGNSNKPISNKAVRVAELNGDLNQKWLKTYPALYSRCFAIKVKGHNNSFYVISQEDFHSVYSKYGLEGNQIFNKTYIPPDLNSNTPFEIFSTSDNNLVLSSYITFNSKEGSYGQLTKIDTSGNVIWNYVSDKDSDYGIPFWATELSNGNIVQVGEVDRYNPNNTEYWDYPPLLRWIDKDGNFIKDTLIRTRPRLGEVNITGLQQGKGDYFFSYGDKDIDDEQWGWVQKIDNEGNILWSHLYRHIDYRGKGQYHYLSHILEENNGDITVYGDIFDFNVPKGYLWLFRVNKDGCFGNDNCVEEEVLFTSVNNMVANINEIKIIPNPTDNRIKVMLTEKLTSCDLFITNLNGQVVYKKKDYSNDDIDVSNFINGTYIIRLESIGLVMNLKFIKL